MSGLMEKMEAMGLKHKYVAEQIGISEQTLCNKLCGAREWKASELKGLQKVLDLSAEEVIELCSKE